MYALTAIAAFEAAGCRKVMILAQTGETATQRDTRISRAPWSHDKLRVGGVKTANAAGPSACEGWVTRLCEREVKRRFGRRFRQASHLKSICGLSRPLWAQDSAGITPREHLLSVSSVCVKLKFSLNFFEKTCFGWTCFHFLGYLGQNN